MSIMSSSAKIASRSLFFVALLVLPGCAAVDASFAPRTDQVTHDVGDQRDNNTFLNIVRASRFDTLNFTTMTKYTAVGSLTLSSNVFQRSLGVNALAPADTFGPISPSGSVSSSFDLGSLENHDFYQGILSEIDPTQINFLLRSGLPRELVLQATIASTKFVTKDNKEYVLVNDPENDSYDFGKDDVVNHSKKCISILRDDYLPAEFLKDHITDCQYSRFMRSLKQALQFGLTTEAVDVPNPAAKSDKSAPPTIPKVSLCFDPSIADGRYKEKPFKPRCGDKHDNDKKLIVLGSGDPELMSIQPNYRSTFGIFLYLGSIIRNNDDVKLVHFKNPPDFFIYKSNGTGCFVKADKYCIPNENAQYSKQLLTLLNTLIALSTKPSALPITPSVQLIP